MPPLVLLVRQATHHTRLGQVVRLVHLLTVLLLVGEVEVPVEGLQKREDALQDVQHGSVRRRFEVWRMCRAAENTCIVL